MGEDYLIENFSHKVIGKTIRQSVLQNDKKATLKKAIIKVLNSNNVQLTTDRHQ